MTTAPSATPESPVRARASRRPPPLPPRAREAAGAACPPAPADPRTRARMPSQGQPDTEAEAPVVLYLAPVPTNGQRRTCASSNRRRHMPRESTDRRGGARFVGGLPRVRHPAWCLVLRRAARRVPWGHVLEPGSRLALGLKGIPPWGPSARLLAYAGIGGHVRSPPCLSRWGARRLLRGALHLPRGPIQGRIGIRSGSLGNPMIDDARRRGRGGAHTAGPHRWAGCHGGRAPGAQEGKSRRERAGGRRPNAHMQRAAHMADT